MNSGSWLFKVFPDAQLDLLAILEGVTIYCCMDSCACSVCLGTHVLVYDACHFTEETNHHQQNKNPETRGS